MSDQPSKYINVYAGTLPGHQVLGGAWNSRWSANQAYSRMVFEAKRVAMLVVRPKPQSVAKYEDQS